eukprot:361326-Chlamydomonas_euryale.AAC.2
MPSLSYTKSNEVSQRLRVFSGSSNPVSFPCTLSTPCTYQTAAARMHDLPIHLHMGIPRSVQPHATCRCCCPMCMLDVGRCMAGP